MSDIDFFTPILFKNPQTVCEHIIGVIEFFFDIRGKSAYVISGKYTGTVLPVTLQHRKQSKFVPIFLAAYKIGLVFGAVKFISSKMAIIPITMFAIKLGFRREHTIWIQTPNNNSYNQKNDVTRQQPTVVHPEQAAVQAPIPSTVASLMERFTNAWDSKMKAFNFPANHFNLPSFTAHLKDHALRFKKADVNREQHFGFLDKFDLDPNDNPVLYIRADLHGDLKSLLENLRSLQEQGLLDQNFKCKPGVHLVFLGDYCDRGQHGVQILELLIRLREENRGQIHLIRGNHEYKRSNGEWGFDDPCLMKILGNVEARESLELFYETMSLGTYFSLKGEKRKEYVKCVHALFEVSTDPAPLLDQGISGDHMPVFKERKLSERVCALINNPDSPLTTAAQRIAKLLDLYLAGYTRGDLEWNATAFNWGDVTDRASSTGALSDRKYKLCGQDIDHYLKLSSVDHRVKLIFRGHQHKFQHLLYKNKVLVTTLPVGMDGPYQKYFNQQDRAYIVKPHFKVKHWTKRALLRSTGHPHTNEITPEYPLTNSII